eukprot:UN16148
MSINPILNSHSAETSTACNRPFPPRKLNALPSFFHSIPPFTKKQYSLPFFFFLLTPSSSPLEEDT